MGHQRRENMVGVNMSNSQTVKPSEILNISTETLPGNPETGCSITGHFRNQAGTHMHEHKHAHTCL